LPASEAASRFPIRSVYERIRRTSHLGHAAAPATSSKAFLAAENRILKAQIKSRLLLSEEEKATLAEIAHIRSATEGLGRPFR
jgi:hypothetical protein